MHVHEYYKNMKSQHIILLLLISGKKSRENFGNTRSPSFNTRDKNFERREFPKLFSRLNNFPGFKFRVLETDFPGKKFREIPNSKSRYEKFREIWIPENRFFYPRFFYPDINSST